MKKIIFCFSLFFIMTISSSTAGFDWDKHKRKIEKELVSVTPIDDVLLYCNTKDFIKNMVVNQYKMQLAADGLVHDEKHKHLASVSMWVNSKKGQWAIVFVYKSEDKSCILGGNDIDLHTP